MAPGFKYTFLPTKGKYLAILISINYLRGKA